MAEEYNAVTTPTISQGLGASNPQIDPNLANTIAAPQEAAAKGLMGWADKLNNFQDIVNNRDLLFYSADLRAKMQAKENELNHLGDDGLPDSPDYSKDRDQVLAKTAQDYLDGIQEHVTPKVLTHLTSTLVPAYQEQGLRFEEQRNAEIQHAKVLGTLQLNTQNISQTYQQAKALGGDPFAPTQQSLYSAIAGENTLYQSYMKIGNQAGATQIAQEMHKQVETSFNLAESTAGGSGWKMMQDIIQNVAPSIPGYGPNMAALQERYNTYRLSGVNDMLGAGGDRADAIKNGTASPAQMQLQDARDANVAGMMGMSAQANPILALNQAQEKFDSSIKSGVSLADAKAQMKDIVTQAEALSQNTAFPKAQETYQKVKALEQSVSNWSAPDLFERSRDGINFYNQIDSRFNIDNPNFLNSDGTLNQGNWQHAVDTSFVTLKTMVTAQKDGKYIYTPQDQAEIVSRYASKFIPANIQRLEKFGDRSALPISQFITSMQSTLGDDAGNGQIMMKAVQQIEKNPALYDPKGETPQLFNRVGLGALYKAAQYGTNLSASTLEQTLADHKLRVAQFGPGAGKEVMPTDFKAELGWDMDFKANGANGASVPLPTEISTYEDAAKAYVNNIIKYDSENGPRLTNQLSLANARAVQTGTPDYTQKILQEDALAALAKAKASFHGGQITGKNSTLGLLGNLFNPSFTAGIGAGGVGRIIPSRFGSFTVEPNVMPYSTTEHGDLPPGVASPAVPATTMWMGANGKDIASIRTDAAMQNTLHYVGTKEGWIGNSPTHINFHSYLGGEDDPSKMEITGGAGISAGQGRFGNAVFTGMQGFFGHPFYAKETPGSFREAATLNKKGLLKIENDEDASPAHVWNELTNAVDNDGLAKFGASTADGRQPFLMGSAQKRLMVKQGNAYVPYLFDRKTQEATNFNVSGQTADLESIDKLAGQSVAYRISRAAMLNQK